MISNWKFQILNRISVHTTCLLCGKRTRRYRFCGGDRGCTNPNYEPETRAELPR